MNDVSISKSGRVSSSAQNVTDAIAAGFNIGRFGFNVDRFQNAPPSIQPSIQSRMNPVDTPPAGYFSIDNAINGTPPNSVNGISTQSISQSDFDTQFGGRAGPGVNGGFDSYSSSNDTNNDGFNDNQTSVGGWGGKAGGATDGNAGAPNAGGGRTAGVSAQTVGNKDVATVGGFQISSGWSDGYGNGITTGSSNANDDTTGKPEVGANPTDFAAGPTTDTSVAQSKADTAKSQANNTTAGVTDFAAGPTTDNSVAQAKADTAANTTDTEVSQVDKVAQSVTEAQKSAGMKAAMDAAAAKEALSRAVADLESKFSNITNPNTKAEVDLALDVAVGSLNSNVTSRMNKSLADLDRLSKSVPSVNATDFAVGPTTDTSVAQAKADTAAKSQANNTTAGVTDFAVGPTTDTSVTQAKANTAKSQAVAAETPSFAQKALDYVKSFFSKPEVDDIAVGSVNSKAEFAKSLAQNANTKAITDDEAQQFAEYTKSDISINLTNDARAKGEIGKNDAKNPYGETVSVTPATDTSAQSQTNSTPAGVTDFAVGPTTDTSVAQAKADTTQSQSNQVTDNTSASTENAAADEVTENQPSVSETANNTPASTGNTAVSSKSAIGTVAGVAKGVAKGVAEVAKGIVGDITSAFGSKNNSNNSGGNDGGEGNVFKKASSTSDQKSLAATYTEEIKREIAPVTVRINDQDKTIKLRRDDLLKVLAEQEQPTVNSYNRDDPLYQLVSDEPALAFEEDGKIFYSNGLYSPKTILGEIQNADSGPMYLYIIEYINEDGVLTEAESNSDVLPGNFATNLIKTIFSDNDPFTFRDISSVTYQLNDPDPKVYRDEYYEYVMRLNDNTIRTTTIPEFSSVAFMYERFSAVGYTSEIPILLSIAKEISPESHTVSLAEKVVGSITKAISTVSKKVFDNGPTEAVTNLPEVPTRHLWAAENIESVYVYPNVGVDCPNIPGLNVGYVYKVVLKNFNNPLLKTVITDAECGAGNSLKIVNEIAVNLEKKYQFSAIETTSLLNKTLVNKNQVPYTIGVVAYRIEPEAVAPTVTVDPKTEVTPPITQKPNLTNTVSFEVKAVSSSGKTLMDWTNSSIEVSSGVNIFFRWDGSDYSQCLPFFNDGGNYSLTKRGNINMASGNTETEGHSLPLRSGTYRVECGGQQNDEFGVDSREIVVRIK